MATLDYCPSCGQVTPVEPTSKTEEIVVRGDNIEVLVEGQRCTICGENFSDANEMDRTLTRAYEAYRKRHSLPAPSDIRELRERYGASQKAFGLILGFGELTINSYEQGALPADANVNLLRLVENPLDFKRLFAARKELIGPTQRKRIESAIAKFDEMVPVSAFAKERSPAYSASSSNESSIYTGYMEPDKDRLFALIRAVLKAVGRPLYKTQILKLLFYCDFSHFRKSTVSISGWPYAAIDFGPVPDDFQLLLPEATSLGLVVCSPDESQERELYSLPDELVENLPCPEFSEDELQTIGEVVARLGSKSAKALVALTHREKAWEKTGHAQHISYEWAGELVGV